MENNVEYSTNRYYCPIYQDMVSDYDCQEISFGALHGYYVNDGLPYLIPIEYVKNKKIICQNCKNCSDTTEKKETGQNKMSDTSKKKESRKIKQNENSLEQAIKFATEKHAGQKRKGTEVPYIVHPLETLSILKTMRAEVSLLIAGVLHDVVEDTDTTIEQVADIFGKDVAYLVGSHSEDKSKSWRERKETDIRETAEGSKELKMLVMADKVSNLRALYSDIVLSGEQVWTRFNAPAEQQDWYYSKMIDALEDMQYNLNTADVYWEMVALYKNIFVTYYYDECDKTIYQKSISGECYALHYGSTEWTVYEEEIPNNLTTVHRKYAERLEDTWAEEYNKTVRYWKRESIGDHTIIALFKVIKTKSEMYGYIYKNGRWKEYDEIAVKAGYDDDYDCITKSEAKKIMKEMQKRENLNCMNEKMPTFEEFKELVRKEFVASSEVVSEKDAMKYFSTKEAQNHIKEEYETAVKEFKNGEICEEGFLLGYVSRVAYCLYMMWE